MLKRQGQRWASSTSIKWRIVILISAAVALSFLVIAIISRGSNEKPHVSSIPLSSTIPVAAEINKNDDISSTTISHGDRLQAINHLNHLAEKGFLTLSPAGPIVFFSDELRTWFNIDGLSIKIDEEAVKSSLSLAYGDVFVEGTDVWLTASDDHLLEISGGEPDRICCSHEDVNRITAALNSGKDYANIDLLAVNRERGRDWITSTGASHLVGEFTTYYPAGRPRVTNIHRIAELTRGVVIEPDETFSLNGHVGERTVENGFVEDGAIVYGVLIQTVGGGISQFATTLFNAAFFAGLDFEEYKSHSIYFQRYPYGREATISWGWPDLKLKNVTPYPIVIWTSVTPDSVTVQFYSQPWVVGEQTNQTTRAIQEECTKVSTERTRTWLETDMTTFDYFEALYRPEGLNCDGTLSDPEACLLDEEAEELVELDPRCPNYVPPTTTTTTTTTTTSEAN